jgi:hypothetical protein
MKVYPRQQQMHPGLMKVHPRQQQKQVFNELFQNGFVHFLLKKKRV